MYHEHAFEAMSEAVMGDEVIPFPKNRTLAPDNLDRALDDWNRAQNAALAVHMFRGMNLDGATVAVRNMIQKDGYAAVARILEETSRALSVFRSMAAEIGDVDRKISLAVEQVTAEAGGTHG